MTARLFLWSVERAARGLHPPPPDPLLAIGTLVEDRATGAVGRVHGRLPDGAVVVRSGELARVVPRHQVLVLRELEPGERVRHVASDRWGTVRRRLGETVYAVVFDLDGTYPLASYLPRASLEPIAWWKPTFVHPCQIPDQHPDREPPHAA